MLELKNTYLGIELGSTRIKAVLIGDDYAPLASGSHDWENRLENGYWTYSPEDIHGGVRACFADLAADVREKYGVPLTTVGAMGVSAMMHGYMAFDKQDKLLVPFRTWRNTTTKQAAEQLSAALGFNIPQRWSIAHLYQAVLNKEPHIGEIAHITTLAGYINYLLTGERAVGVGEASGVFPVENGAYNADYMRTAEKMLAEQGFSLPLAEVMPPIKTAGEGGAYLTEEGAAFLDPTGTLKAGVPLCPPEGDAGTGMAAANAVRVGTGNVSAGTSTFSMLVLDKNPAAAYPEIDMVTTPDGAPAAMVHCNNCCSELDAWVKLFGEFAALTGNAIDRSALYETLYKNAMTGDPDCGGVTSFNYLSGEPVTGAESGRPMYFRQPDGKMDLANFFRAQIYSAFATLKIGMDILFEKEQVKAQQFTGHGGIFKVKGAAQQVLADALDTPVSVMATAGEGGAWGMALLAAYMVKGGGKTLPDWLDREVFADIEKLTAAPEAEGKRGFDEYIRRYKAALAAEKLLGDVK